MEAMALMFALFLPPSRPFPQNGHLVCTCRPEDIDVRDWDWEGRPISLNDADGWKFYDGMKWQKKKTINPQLVCFGQGKKKRVICGELSGKMEF